MCQVSVWCPSEVLIRASWTPSVHVLALGVLPVGGRLSLETRTLSPEVYDAIVVSVHNFGLFVEIPDLQVQGLVHVSALSDRFVRYSQKDRTLRAGRTRYAVETRLPVQVASVDIESRRLDFVPA